MRHKTLNLITCYGLSLLSVLTLSNPVIAQSSLAGTNWRLDSFGRSDAQDAVLEGTTITIQFGTDGRVNGSSGCNSYSGTYTADAERVSFGQMISTMRACTEPKANEQEQRYMAALRSISRFIIDQKRLTLSDGGDVVLNFINPSEARKAEDTNSPVKTLKAYFVAINEKRYGAAFKFWEHSSTTLKNFERGYADTRSVRFMIEPSYKIEGAAGSSYAQVPTIILARTSSGSERVFAGCYVLRKSNVEEPPTGWRIHKASISPVSPKTSLSALLSRSCND